nr:immunoglobulin heavy chain junction region [Mus musculus]NSM04558.1 immunoglobulin heavy chain junction region [Mus musculus]NSM07689.1 immunoglobulin heavy chain junction region [Mus musculus]
CTMSNWDYFDYW